MKKKKIGIREYYRLNPTCICGKLINKGQPFGGHPEHKVELDSQTKQEEGGKE